MRTQQIKKYCLFTFGLLATVAMDCDIAVGQSSSNGQQIGRLGLIETARYINLPTTFLQDETSPSDASPKSEEQSGTKTNGESSSRRDNDQTANADEDTITPMQNRELTIRVQPVSIANEKIGTGLVPQSGSPRSSEQLPLPTGISRGMNYTQVCWRASNIQHFPLYFEDAMLERHGHTRCFRGYVLPQSLVSGLKFFGTIPVLPYLHTLRPRHDCVYALGHYRPGSCAPCLRDNIPYDAQAAIVESASAAAFFWAVPL